MKSNTKEQVHRAKVTSKKKLNKTANIYIHLH